MPTVLCPEKPVTLIVFSFFLKIIVDKRLCAVSDPHRSIYALGDCAYVRNQAYPCTAQVAERQGKYLASTLSHKPTAGNPLPEEFVFKPWIMLAYVGGYKAIHDTPVDKSKGACTHVIHGGLVLAVCGGGERAFVLLVPI